MKNLFLLFLVFSLFVSCKTDKRPNVLFVISDDQSHAHTSYSGCEFVNTPAFDRIAREGVFFSNCIAGSPGCAPSRSTIATGRFHWQNEQAGQHASHWPAKYSSMVDEFELSGYAIGRTGKGVGPFKYGAPFREINAAGRSADSVFYQKGSDQRTAKGISKIDYFSNFKKFIDRTDTSKPFFFWYGAFEPHRSFEKGSWKKLGKKLEDAVVPGFLPDTKVVRGDLLDYAVEIEWFDDHLNKMLKLLEEKGELDNTIVIVTSDNGMSFPRAKANCYEYGVHVPFAVRYPKLIKPNRKVDNVISFADIAPTLFDICNIEPQKMLKMSGDNITPLLENDGSGVLETDRKYVFSGRERHSCSRYQNRGYPQRAIRSNKYLLIWNVCSERWPAGAPQRLKAKGSEECYPYYGLNKENKHNSEWAFTDVDAAPSKSELVECREQFPKLFEDAFFKRPEWELYDVVSDPYCQVNLVDSKEYGEELTKMKEQLLLKLKETQDPRVSESNFGIFDTYPRYIKMRAFPKP